MSSSSSRRPAAARSSAPGGGGRLLAPIVLAVALMAASSASANRSLQNKFDVEEVVAEQYASGGEQLAMCPAPQPAKDLSHYLVGLLRYPNSFVPEVFQGKTSGSFLTDSLPDNEAISYVPSVGFSDIEPHYAPDGSRSMNTFYCLSDNGYGSSMNSFDYPLNIVQMEIAKPFLFGHGGFKAEEVYTETTNQRTVILHDPSGYIKWENGADISTAYWTPDSTWDEWKAMRVLTGRDFDVEGLAVKNSTYAIVGDELMPAIFPISLETGEVVGPFLRTPDIDLESFDFNGKYLSTQGDRVHCDVDGLEANPTDCHQGSVTEEQVTDAGYKLSDPSGGFEGFSFIEGTNTIIGFLEKQAKDLVGEPGVRVYEITADPLEFKRFIGFYKFEDGAGNIADVSAIPGSTTRLAVIERNGFPTGGNTWPRAIKPANRVCIIDLTKMDSDRVFEKECVANYHRISDPFDVNQDGLTTFALTALTTEQLIVVDDYCFLAGTDTNWPWTNQGAIPEEATRYEEDNDTRFMVVCYYEPIFKA